MDLVNSCVNCSSSCSRRDSHAVFRPRDNWSHPPHFPGSHEPSPASRPGSHEPSPAARPPPLCLCLSSTTSMCGVHCSCKTRRTSSPFKTYPIHNNKYRMNLIKKCLKQRDRFTIINPIPLSPPPSPPPPPMQHVVILLCCISEHVESHLFPFPLI